ncbi:Ubiquitin carboxyl-terminal hydrolase 1 [Liparis tanakae]|uniref:Ubiquitin carboxyl-terminal hydrolase 1 n=1 Tax=Liparis tanakae TaxID=230148 RepID=A0A4Z2F7M9_9TELE|nr:Ubiquitin carboxyl-terminal hydrolase 1 [Liparis tanakae]
MPGVQRGGVVAALGSPIRRSKLSLKFLQKKETKRALDFSEPRADEPKAAEEVEPEASGCDQTVPCPASPGLLLSGDKREGLAPFVGFNNLGNTCYLNSILQSEVVGAALPAHIELLGSFNSLITSAEQLQSNFLLNPDSFGDGELATPPRKILNTLRQLNPMYEGYLQHDAQEVLQCILGYIQEACATIRKEQESERDEAREAEVKLEDDVRSGSSGGSAPESKSPSEEEDEGQVSGKRKSDTEVGNAKKKPKSVKSKKAEAEDDKPLTRSKRKSVGDIAATGDKEEEEGAEKEKTKKLNGAEEKGGEGKGDKAAKEADGKGKKRSRLSWLRPSGKQPSIFSKFLSVGKISSAKNNNNNNKHESETGGERSPAEETSEETAPEKEDEEEEETPVKLQGTRLYCKQRWTSIGSGVFFTRCKKCW